MITTMASSALGRLADSFGCGQVSPPRDFNAMMDFNE